MNKASREKANPIQVSVRSARLWHVTVLVAEEASLPLGIVLCLRVSQLLAGVRIASSPGMLGAGALAVTVMLGWVWLRVVRRLRTPYEIAQLVDAGFDLHDLFSTAWFLLEHPGFVDDTEAAAHIARATMRVPEIRSRTLFPPGMRLGVVASLLGGLVATGVMRPRALSVIFRNSVSLPPAASRITGGAFHQKQSSQKRTEGESPGITSPADENDNALNARHAESSRAHVETSHASAVQEDAPMAGVEKSQDKVAAVGVAPQASATAKAASNHPNTVPASTDEVRSGDPEPSQAPLMSRLLSPMKRLLGTVEQQSQEAATEKDASSPPAPPAANSIASDRPQAQPQGPAFNQHEHAPDYTSAEASSQQTAGSLPPGIGGRQRRTAPDPLDGYAASAKAIDLVVANPRGESGHTRTLAVENGRRGEKMDPTHSRHDAVFTRQMRQDDVPLAYQRSIQAYLERRWEHQGGLR